MGVNINWSQWNHWLLDLKGRRLNLPAFHEKCWFLEKVMSDRAEEEKSDRRRKRLR